MHNMGAFLDKNLTLNMGGGTFLCESLTSNRGALLGTNLTHNMGAFIGTNLTLNMEGTFSCESL